MAWLRIYDDLPDDPKLDALDVHQKWLWIVCLCLANKSKERGRLLLTDTLPMPVKTIARKAGITPEQAEEALELFAALDMMDYDHEERTWCISNWSKRQFESDSSRDRVKAHRERLKEHGLSPTGAATHRPAVMERDGQCCVYCGSAANVVLDRLVPVALGGDDDPLNLVAACRPCTGKKVGRLPDAAGMTVFEERTAEQYLQNLQRLGMTGHALEVVPLPDEPGEPMSDDVVILDAPPETERLDAKEPALTRSRGVFEPTPEAQEVIAWVNHVLPNWYLSGDPYRQLLEYGDRLSWSVLRRAVETTLGSNKETINYCLSICRRWDDKHIRSLEDLKTVEKMAKSPAQRLGKSGGGSGGGRRTADTARTDPPPKKKGRFDRFVDR